MSVFVLPILVHLSLHMTDGYAMLRTYRRCARCVTKVSVIAGRKVTQDSIILITDIRRYGSITVSIIDIFLKIIVFNLKI